LHGGWSSWVVRPALQQCLRPSALLNVCSQNKKNRRWQSAINTCGKYIYLGSFISEEEAGRAFDRAALRLRGARAKLNYKYEDYIDGQVRSMV
jgi:hypothetical protein